jgi:peptidoglycan/xylan/chitin deacetylase (PgdA/CDA1 family)
MGLANEPELRCVLFHDVSDHTTPFTKGLGVTMGLREFEARIRYLAENYTPVSFQNLLNGSGNDRPRKPVLVTFDDAYASVLHNAAPICRKWGVPALFFVNACCLNNARLLIDNLITYAVNTFGLAAVNEQIWSMKPEVAGKQYSPSAIFSEFLPSLSLTERKEFEDRLVASTGVRATELARKAGIHLSEQEVKQLSGSGFEIGDHTFSHVHCRALTDTELRDEIDGNRAMLEGLLGRRMQAFSVPYGSSADYTPELAAHLRRVGYQAAFLVESLPNRYPLDFQRLYRVSVHSRSALDFWADLEVRPHLRLVRNRYFRRPINGRVTA